VKHATLTSVLWSFLIDLKPYFPPPDISDLFPFLHPR
jgi:hypothetical protein